MEKKSRNSKFHEPLSKVMIIIVTYDNLNKLGYNNMVF